MSEPTSQFLKGRYEIERPLGRGGMSAVYLAKDHQLLAKRVVVKVLLDEMTGDSWVRQKFSQEMEALARIDHPGVVGVLDTGQTADGKQFLVMQYVEGQTLREAIQPGGLPLDRAANLIRQIGSALGAAHDAGVWHRDLKPENIMLQRSSGEEYAKLIDFGIAGIHNSQFTGQQTKVAGSLSYMAPEQFAGNACAASDLYAFGVVAYEILTGQSPFPPGSMTHLVADDGTMVMPRSLRRELPERAEPVLLKALAFQLEARHTSVREFSEELSNVLSGAAPARRSSIPGSLEMAHVLFTDLVGYSLLPMDRQKQFLAELQALVRATPRFRAAERDGDLLCLPTGDGMALVFFGDPTSAAQCAIEIGSALQSRPHLQLRMGIHTGPVYRVADVNANANVSGGGINIAQRVMDCGDAGHILVSKSVADVLAELSDWAPRLCNLGEHAVKHGVRVHLYNLASADAGNARTPSRLAPPPPSKRSRTPWIAAAVLIGLVAAGVAGWFATRPKAAPAGAAQAEPLALTYRTQRTGPLLWFEVFAPRQGFLYIVNYGQESAGGPWTFHLLYPRGGRSASRTAGETLRVPETSGFRANTQTDRNYPYLVWSAAPIPEMERMKMLPLAPEDGSPVLSDPAGVAALREFLRQHDGQLTAQDGATEIRSEKAVLAHQIPLESH